MSSGFSEEAKDVLLDAIAMLSFDVELRPRTSVLSPWPMNVFTLFLCALEIVEDNRNEMRQQINSRQTMFAKGLREPLLDIVIQKSPKFINVGGVDRIQLINALIETQGKYDSKQDQADAILKILNKK